MLLALAATVLAPIAPTDEPRAIVEQAVEAMGGETWLNPKALKLEGSATFYVPMSAIPASRFDRWVMWRAMDPNRTAAHKADGKIRILGQVGGRIMFHMGYDGTTTWVNRRVLSKAEADAYWASNFGFGILRRALTPGFKLERAPDRTVDGHALAMVRVIDPEQAETLFGIDRASRLIRYMGFRTPAGWHERIYDDFLTIKNPRWVQARTVTLTYDGVLQNVVRWDKVTLDPELPPGHFSPPPDAKEQ